MEAFFGKYPGFNYQVNGGSSIDFNVQFERLTEYRKWKVGGVKYKKAMREFQEAKQIHSHSRTNHPPVQPPIPALTTAIVLPIAPSRITRPSSANVGALASSSSRSVQDNHGAAPRTQNPPSSAGNMSAGTQSTPRQRMKPVRVSVQVTLLAPGGDAAFQEATPMDDYFAQWESEAFVYNPYAHPIDEYERMAELLNWDTNQYYSQYKPFYDATRKEFRWQIFRPRQLTVRKRIMRAVNGPQPAQIDGIVANAEDDGNDLALKAFNRLCLIFGRERGDGQEEAEKNLASIHVNIHDLIHHLRRNTTDRLHRFTSIKELGRYSYEHGIVYPFDEAGHNEVSNVIRYLLRKIKQYKVRRRGKPRGCSDPEFDRRLH